MDAVLSDKTRRGWDRVAPGYDELVTPCYFGLGARALQSAGLQPGMRLLDVASGSGALALVGARLGAKVTAVDISPVMIARLKARAAQEGIEVEARAMDGHALDFADGSFELVGSAFGVMLFEDMPRGLREMARVAKPSGKLLVVALAHPDGIEFLQVFFRAVQAAVPSFAPPPMDPLPLPFQLQDPDRLRREMQAAGLKDVQVERSSTQLTFSSGRQFWDWVMSSNPFASEVLSGIDLKPDVVAAIVQAANDLICERAGGAESAVLTSPLNIGIGTK